MPITEKDISSWFDEVESKNECVESLLVSNIRVMELIEKVVGDDFDHNAECCQSNGALGMLYLANVFDLGLSYDGPKFVVLYGTKGFSLKVNLI